MAIHNPVKNGEWNVKKKVERFVENRDYRYDIYREETELSPHINKV